MTSLAPPHLLTTLTHAPADTVKAFADAILDDLGPVTVLQNRTGLVMLPYTDTAHGTRFHLGEVLVTEAQVRLHNGVEGYAVCVGRDLLQALAVALVDAARRAGIRSADIDAFVAAQRRDQEAVDAELLRQVEATRIEMETF